MLHIANDEIMLLLDEKVFFFNENDYYTSMSVKEAKKKTLKTFLLTGIQEFLPTINHIYCYLMII